MKIRIPIIFALILIVLTNVIVFILVKRDADAPKPFLYRDKIAFHCSPNNVRDAFGERKVESLDTNDRLLKMSDIVAGFNAEITFVFYNSQLGIIAVETGKYPKQAYDAFKKGLNGLYSDNSARRPKNPVATMTIDKQAESESVFWIRDDVEISLQLFEGDKGSMARLTYTAPDLPEIKNQSGL